jgi:hypothetical protein
MATRDFNNIINNFLMKKEGLTFGEAIEALKKGKRVARAGWNGKGMFIFMQVPAEIEIYNVHNMQSLPQEVKDEFIRRDEDSIWNQGEDSLPNPHDSIRYKNQIAMVYPDNTIYGWVASPSDVLEEDWCIL